MKQKQPTQQQKKLIHIPSQTIIANQVHEAKNLWSRTKGLLGSKSLNAGHCLWIYRCNSIHTFFMKYSIDLIFIDANLRVVKWHIAVKPWTFTWPVWKARSVFELPPNTLNNIQLNIGDHLYVGN